MQSSCNTMYLFIFIIPYFHHSTIDCDWQLQIIVVLKLSMLKCHGNNRPNLWEMREGCHIAVFVSKFVCSLLTKYY